MMRLELPSGRPLLVQSDALRGTRYGGNKARKFEGILAEARRVGATRLVSVGAVGSHHVLATAIFAQEAGLRCRCYVVPQPDVPSTRMNVQYALAAGAEIVPVRTEAEAALRLAWSLGEPGSLAVPVGGSSLAGTRPYVDAVAELGNDGAKLRTLVLALGSGGTAAGIAVGGALARAPWRVDAVATSGPLWVVRALARSLVLRLLPRRPRLLADAWRRLRLVETQLGAGYALATAASVHALKVAAHMGLELEPVYTAKAFAHVLELDARGETGLGFWATASRVDRSWLGPVAPLPDSIAQLFR